MERRRRKLGNSSGACGSPTSPTSPVPLESESMDAASTAKEFRRGGSGSGENSGGGRVQKLGRPFKWRRGEPAQQG